MNPIKTITINLKGYNFPFEVEQAKKSEEQNPDIALNIYTADNKGDFSTVSQLYISSQLNRQIKFRTLLATKGELVTGKTFEDGSLAVKEVIHKCCVLIRELSALINCDNGTCVCDNCSHSFAAQARLDQHLQYGCSEPHGLHH